MNPRTLSTATRSGQAGLSIVEMLVGLAVGLFLIGGAIKLFIDNLDSNRRLLMETRVNQDLRAAADLIVRDLRRAGYWANAASGVWQANGAAPAASPHAAPAASAGQFTYSFDEGGVLVNGGFWLDGGTLRTRVGAAWQPLTDPATMTVTQFVVTPDHRVIDLLPRCPVTTCGAAPNCPPSLTVRQFNITLRAQANGDPNIVRQLDETVRVRNDRLIGACPPSPPPPPP